MDVCIFEPVSPGSNRYCKTSIITPVMTADFRVGPELDGQTGKVSNKLEFTPVETVGVDGGQPNLFELSSASKQLILSELLSDGGYVEERVNELGGTQDSSSWACQHCTYINVTARSRCGVCSKARH